MDADNVGQIQRLIGRKQGTLPVTRNNIAISHKCANDRLIYPLCLYVKNTPEIPTVSLQTLMFTNNDGDITNRDGFNEPIQYMNDSPNTNPIPFTTGAYNQEPVTYKHPYTLFLPSIYTSSRYANKKYCLFYINVICT